MGDARAAEPGTDLRTSVRHLVDRCQLPAGSQAKLLRLLALLAHHPAAPTSIREPKRALDDHLADSLVALELRAVSSAATIADLGSGAGVPGIPLAIALPSAEVFLVESNAKKCAFMRRALAECEVTNGRVVNARAEGWPEGLGRFELVTARALASLPVVAEYAAPLLRVGGTLVAWRGRRDPADERAAAAAATQLGLEPSEPLPVVPYPGARDRHLHLMLKVSETPSRFPRRLGAAAKSPLGAHGR